MGLLRGRGGVEGTKYRMREKMFAIGDDFWIENEDGERAFKVDGKALRIRDTLVLEDASSGAELYKIQEKKLTIRDKMAIEREGETVATVKKALIPRSAIASRSRSKAVRTWKRREISSITSTRSNGAAKGLPRCRSGGSGSATRTASRSQKVRRRRYCSPSLSVSTRWREADPPLAPTLLEGSTRTAFRLFDRLLHPMDGRGCLPLGCALGCAPHEVHDTSGTPDPHS